MWKCATKFSHVNEFWGIQIGYSTVINCGFHQFEGPVSWYYLWTVVRIESLLAISLPRGLFLFFFFSLMIPPFLFLQLLLSWHHWNFFQSFCTISELIKTILKNNNLSFLDRHFPQIAGTAMGTKATPPYTNLLMGHHEETIREAFN